MRIINHLDTLKDYFKNWKLEAPITVEIDLTNACNHKCPKCSTTLLHQSAGSEKIKWTSFTEESAIKLIKEFEEMGVKSLIFTGGGDPLAFPKFKNVIKSCTKKLDLGLKTNGGLIKVNDLETLVNFKWIRFSVDSATKSTFKLVHGVDDFDNVCKNIELLCKKRTATKIGIGFLLGDHISISELELGCRMAKELGADYIQFRPFSDWKDEGHFNESIVKLRNELEDHRFKIIFPNPARLGVKWTYPKCHAVHMVPKIAANMDVYACCARRDDQVLLGNLKDHTFREIWETKNLEYLDLSKCLDICRHHQTNVDIDSIYRYLTDSDRNFL